MQYTHKSKGNVAYIGAQKLLQTLLVTVLLFVAGINTVCAQTITASDQEELRRRTQQEAAERRNREQSKDTFLQPNVKPIEEIILPLEEISFPIRTFILEGQRTQQFPWIQKILDQYKDQKIGKEGINIIVKRLTTELIDRGYTTTRIGIPQQDLSRGVLKLTLIPGVIREIRFDTSRIRANWRTAFPTRPGNILNIRDIEQGLEQIKRVPSQDVDMKIAPGDKLGESDIVISAKSTTPVRMSFSFDDSGTKSTGKLQSSTSLAVDNLFGLNDLLYISFNKDAEQKDYHYGTKGNSYQFSVPYGYWTFTLSESFYDYHQFVPGQVQSFVSSGQTETKEYRVQRLVHRDQQSKTSVQFGVVKKKSKSFLNETEIGPQHKDVTADELGINHRRYYGQTVLNITLSHRWGVPWLSAQPEPESPGSDTPTNRYKMWIVDATITKPIAYGSTQGRYTLNFRMQQTKDILYTADYFSIGNRYTVRGFDGEQTLAAENGWFVRNEWSMPLSKSREIYVGLDYGEVGGPGAQWLLDTKLAGAVIGIRGNIGKTISYEVFTGWPIYKPRGYDTDPHPVGFQLAFQM